MIGDANVIENAVELGDDIVDLSGQVARVDRHEERSTRGETKHFSFQQDSK